MNPPHFLDINILLYSITRNPKEASKRERAIRLLEDDNGALSVQVLQEFYVERRIRDQGGIRLFLLG
ncbi:MAG TPA: hypothetical protein VGM07_05475 [Stellaceae bacterium]|jgi:predicted nucleic acid-binding protein